VEKASLLDMLLLAEFPSGFASPNIMLRAVHRSARHTIKIIREAIDNNWSKRGCLKHRQTSLTHICVIYEIANLTFIRCQR